MKIIAITVTLAITILALVAWTSYPEHLLPFPQPARTSSAGKNMTPDSKSASKSGLSELALDKVLEDASPIFGEYEYATTDASNWMAAYPDETLLVHMNLPGAHDAATWNYSVETQEELKKVTNLVNSTLSFDSNSFRCQDTPLIQMLNAGVRVFDLRYAFDVTKASITFWHGPALLSEKATLDDVFFGFYRWLDDHPTEALLLSFQYEASEGMHNQDNKDVQTSLHQSLTNAVAKKYISQTRDVLGSLGDVRGKITLLRRFDLDKMSAEYETSIPGLHFSPNDWVINGPNTTLVYNASPGRRGETGKAYIQDYYFPKTPKDSSTAENVKDKMKAVIPHFQMAASEKHKNALFWHFTSCTHPPTSSPRMMALGEEASEEVSERVAVENSKAVQGVNHQLIPVLKEMKGKRLGIVMFDFFEQPQGLLPLFLSLLSPDEMQKATKT